jgi:hypothetical protein
MGVFDFLFGGSSNQPAVTTTKQEIPSWIQQPIQENIQLAGQLAARPYEAYQAPTVAGFSPMQQAAQQYATQGVGYSLPAYAQAQQVAAQETGYQAPQFLGSDIAGYMSPYTQNVMDVAQQQLQRQTQQQLQNIGQQARAARAFGGSRQGLQEGVLRAESARAAGELAANLQNQAFQQATALQQADFARQQQASGQRLGAAQQLAALGAGGQAAIGQDVSMLAGLGSQQQALQQAQLQDQYRRWQEAQQYPLQMLALRQAAIPGGGVGQTQTATTSGGTSASPFLSGLGGLATGLSAGRALTGPTGSVSPYWGIGGGLLGLLGGM